VFVEGVLESVGELEKTVYKYSSLIKRFLGSTALRSSVFATLTTWLIIANHRQLAITRWRLFWAVSILPSLKEFVGYLDLRWQRAKFCARFCFNAASLPGVDQGQSRLELQQLDCAQQLRNI